MNETIKKPRIVKRSGKAPFAALPLLDLNLALKHDPFAGDTDGDVVLFSDKIVTARKPSKCHNCGDQIKPGMRIRSRREKFDGSMVNYKWCDQCTCNMALGNDDALELSGSSAKFADAATLKAVCECLNRRTKMLKRVLEWCEQESPNFEIDADAIRAELALGSNDKLRQDAPANPKS